MVLVGALQGLVLWSLWRACEDQFWPATAPVALGALLWIAIAVPAAYYLSENAGLARARRRVLLLGIAIAYGLLGAYAGWMGEPLNESEQARRLIGHANAFGHILAAGVMGFMLLPLVCGWQSAQKRFVYPQLFVLAWRNALLSASVVAITGLFWAVLYAGAMLMKSIGVDFIEELIEKPIFAFPVTGMVVGGAFAVGHARAELLVHLRRYWLALNAWLLPLLLFFGVMWVVMLPVTGLDPLLRTHNASFTLLWFAALAICFVNAAWQDGEDGQFFPRWLAAVLAPAWLTLLFVTGIAGWALWLRIGQYGLTEDRVWGAFVWLLAAGYAVGYSLSLLPSLLPARWREQLRRGWMPTVAPTNVALALVAVTCLALLTSPLLDPRRLGVNAQMARLESGAVEPDKFDYRYLHWESGQWGRSALQEMAQRQGSPRHVAIAEFARLELARKKRWGDAPNPGETLTLADVRARLTVLAAPGETAGGALPDSLVEYLRVPGTQRSAPDCLQPGHRCGVWLQDFNADGKSEALVLDSEGENDHVSAYLLTPKGAQWRQVDTLCCEMTLPEWSSAIGKGEVRTVAPAWPDIQVGSRRLHVVDEVASP